CELVDGFALFMQALLALIALASLLVKRQREQSRRPVRVWLFDVSKQTTGAALVHMLNLFISYVSGSQSDSREDNPCVWYLLNLLLDTTVGVLVLCVVLKVLHQLLSSFGIKEMESGNYGNPPQYHIWVKQSLVFLLALSATKLIIYAGINVFPILVIIGQWILDPFVRVGDPRLQVIVVTLIAPLIMNIVQFWLVDNLIRHRVITSLEE
ncbi:hypothetical protein K493DRAFT_132863, partial [Basidiobolus meristosporus CBS 931.73]